jgi:thiamine pyrophosphokinase
LPPALPNPALPNLPASPIAAAMSAAFTPFVILLGGSLSATPRLRAQISGARVIAADGGMTHAQTLGVMPELWIGDFDSTSPELEAAYQDVPRERFDPAKAQSDGELAVNRALSLGASALVLAGALGGPRADHQMMLLTQAAALTEAGVPVLLTSGHEEAVIVTAGEMRTALPAETLFSIVPFTSLSGLTITGARWPLETADVSFGSTLTLSNVAEGPVTVRLESGRAVLFADFRQNQ